eukprot:GGOE01052982.1.p1 GENE.GGOE01052982.1~~GGOE01052982.1.p1  ORF type:complete len:807 (+),score=270.53 GGOE01052982.1:91-2511(+)
MLFSMKWAFLAAGLVSLGCIIGTGLLLAFSTTAMTEDLVLQGGESQVRTAVAKIQTQMLHLQVTCDSFGGYFTLDLGWKDISTPELVVNAYNETFFNLSMRHLQSPGSQMGITLNFLYPPGNVTRTEYNTIQALNDWGGTTGNPSEPGRLVTYTYTQPNGVDNIAWMVDASGPHPHIVGEAYRFSQLEYYISLEGRDQYWDRIWPWIAADGTSYLFLTYQRAYEVQGVPVIVQSLELVQDWYKHLVESVTNGTGQLIVVDNFGQLVASSIDSGLKLSCNYVFIGSSFIKCDPLLAQNSPQQLVRDMSGMVGLLPQGQTTAQGRHVLDGTDYFYVIRKLINDGALDLTVVWVRTRDSLMGDLLDTQTLILGVGCALTAITSAAVALLAIWGLLRPLDKVVISMGKVRMLEVDDSNEVTRKSCITELRHMQNEFAAMMSTITSFTKYIPRQLVRDMIASGTGLAKLGMKPYEITVLFLDIVDFSQVCEMVGHDSLAVLMQTFFTKISTIVSKHSGSVDKYLGDAIMCLWGAPLPCDAHQQRACCAALAIHAAVSCRLQPVFQQQGADRLAIQIGIQTGAALCGNLGDAEHVCFTATGDTVSAAARLVGLNAQFGTSVLITWAIQQAVMRLFVCRFMGSTKLGPTDTGTSIYTLHGLVDNPLIEAAEGDGDDQSVMARLADLARWGVICPTLLTECADQYSIGLRFLKNGAVGEAAEVFKECRELLQVLQEEGGKVAPTTAGDPNPQEPPLSAAPASPIYLLIPDAPRRLPKRVPMAWLVGSLEQNLVERLSECHARQKSPPGAAAGPA